MTPVIAVTPSPAHAYSFFPADALREGIPMELKGSHGMWVDFPSLSSFALVARYLHPVLKSLIVVKASAPSMSLLQQPVALSPVADKDSYLGPGAFSVAMV